MQEAKEKDKESKRVAERKLPVVQWYDARARVALRCLSSLLGVPWLKARSLFPCTNVLVRHVGSGHAASASSVWLAGGCMNQGLCRCVCLLRRHSTGLAGGCGPDPGEPRLQTIPDL